MNEALRISIRFIVLVLVQGAVLINLSMLDGLMQLNLYVLFIILLPLRTPQSLVLLAGFVLGLVMDSFYNSPGLHASACVLMAFVRPSLLQALTPREDYEVTDRPSIADMGLSWFIRYAGILCLVHSIWLYLVERFSFTAFGTTLAKGFLSSLLTLAVIILLEYLLGAKRKAAA